MDSRGCVDFAATDPESGSWFEGDSALDAMRGSWLSGPGGRFCAVFDIGDLIRIERMGAGMDRAAYEDRRREALRTADQLIGELMAEMDNALAPYSLIIVSPFKTSAVDEPTNNLAPIIIVDPKLGHGLLTSPSTRRSGIIVNSDFLPTALAILDVKPEGEKIGRQASVVTSSDRITPAMMAAFEIGIRDRDQVRRSMGTPFSISCIALMVAGLILLILSARRPKLIRAAQLTILAAAVLTVAVLPGWPISSTSVAVTCAGLLAICVAFYGLTGIVNLSPMRRLVILSAITVILMAVEIVRGAPNTPFTVLGYSYSVGSRYYGVGNELFGVLMGGAFILAGALLAERRARIAGAAAILGLLIVAGLDGHPRFGADFGGALSAAVGVAAVAALIFAGKIGRREIGIAVIGVVAMLALLVAYDRLSGGGSSHIARLLSSPHEILSTAADKLMREWKTAQHSLYTCLLIAGTMVTAIAWRRGATMTRGLHIGVIGAIVVAATSIPTNDSGILSAALIMIYVAAAVVACTQQQGANDESYDIA